MTPRSHWTAKGGWVGTGEYQNAWAEELRALIAANPLPVIVPDPGTEHGRALVLALGADYEPHSDEPDFKGRPESEYRAHVAEVRAQLRRTEFQLHRKEPT